MKHGWQRSEPGKYVYRNSEGELLAGIAKHFDSWVITVFPLAERARKVTIEQPVWTLAEAKRRAEANYNRLSSLAI